MNERFSDLIILLASGINQRRMYFDNHPKVKAACQEFTTRLGDLIVDTGENEFTFGVFGGKFIRHGKYLVGPSIAGRSLIEFSERLGCGGFVFRLPLTEMDMATFFRLGATQKESLAGLEEARELFAANGIGHVELAAGFKEEGDGDQGGAKEEGRATADFLAEDFAPLLNIYQALYETVSSNNLSISNNDAVDMSQARTGGESLVGASESGAMDVMQFLRYPDYDSYTIGHSVRVAALASILGRELGWPREILTELATAGLVHDLGKGLIPEGILFKAGKLDDEERKIVESHPVAGAQILLASGEKSPIIVSATWGHHIRDDGRGYPVMPSWYTHGEAASLIHVCDVFEALTAVRPYKDPMPPRRAYEIMLKDEGGFSPGYLATLIRVLGLYPTGSEVALSDGSRAVVVARGAELDQPRVRVTHDPEGNPIPQSGQPAIQLEAEGDLQIEEFHVIGVSGDSGYTAGPPQSEDITITTGFSEVFS